MADQADWLWDAPARSSGQSAAAQARLQAAGGERVAMHPHRLRMLTVHSCTFLSENLFWKGVASFSASITPTAMT